MDALAHSFIRRLAVPCTFWRIRWCNFESTHRMPVRIRKSEGIDWSIMASQTHLQGLQQFVAKDDRHDDLVLLHR
jgi:hypothetical protein